MNCFTPSVVLRPLLMALAALAAALLLVLAGPAQAAVQTPYPIVFVTQVPLPSDFTNIGSTFGHHLSTQQAVPRGGDLWIRYADGSLRNLTAAAGLSSSGGLQGANAIAVRDPSPHWDGKKIVFSAVVGAPTERYREQATYWQLYEMTGLGATETPVVTKIARQPADYNNVNAIYGTDDRIIFASDRPRSGERHLYPQRDEYEEAPTVTGLWSLDTKTGDLMMLNHTPSGAFTPSIDSFGRVIFTRWDHLQRDQQADTDRANETYGTFNYSSESASATALNDRSEVFPESRETVGNISGLRFNQFFPWQINEDGTEEETLNHVGRQELAGYGDRSFLDDSNLVECCNTEGRFNKFRLNNDSLLHIKEDPTKPGRFVGTSAQEFSTHAAGQLVALSGAPSTNADQMAVTWLTASATAFAREDNQAVDPNHSGLYRDPVPLSDGKLIASHTSETRADANAGTNDAPRSRYDFRLKLITADASGTYKAGEALTSGISKTVSWYDPDTLLSYSGPLWEMNAVELRPRTRPARRGASLPAPEQQVFNEEGVNVAAFQDYLRRNDLALMVSRNVTQRDKADRQQPYNLRIKGGTSSTGSSGKMYDVSHLQFFQGDQIRGIGGTASPREGRRVLAQVMHAPQASNPFQGVKGGVSLAADGSVAALVPASRSMSWQLTNGETPVVRERYWISFQKGEIRVCASCHGVNQKSQSGAAESQTPPEGLRRLLRYYKAGLNLSSEDRVFNWAERQYPNNFLPKNAATGTAQGYTYRYYSATDEYVGVKDGKVYYFKPGVTPAPQDVGSLQTYLQSAAQAGY